MDILVYFTIEWLVFIIGVLIYSKFSSIKSYIKFFCQKNNFYIFVACVKTCILRGWETKRGEGDKGEKGEVRLKPLSLFPFCLLSREGFIKGGCGEI